MKTTKILKHKGFIGSIEQEEDNTFYGKVLDLDKDTLITYQGDTLEELEGDFIEAVEDYIIHCKEYNISLPNKKASTLNTFVRETLQKAAVM